MRAWAKALPWAFVALLILTWQMAISHQPAAILPTPWAVVLGIQELAVKGLLLKYVVASLFRVTWGYVLAVVTAIPFGLVLGWNRRGEMAVNPLIQVLRPISALAWIPISILWFGVGDVAAIFLIFLASFLPLTVAAMNAVRNVPPTLLRAGSNFGLSGWKLIWSVI